MNQHRRPALLRSTAARLAVAAVAGAATVASMAPAAVAVDEPSDPTSPVPSEVPAEEPQEQAPPAGAGDAEGTEDPAQAEPEGDTAAAEDDAQEQDADEATAAAVEPVYGLQKYRVGVQVADGSFVPDGITTVGTELTITQTTPARGEGGAPRVDTFTCTTDASTVEEGSTASYCLITDTDFPDPFEDLFEAARGRIADVVVEPDDGGDEDQYFPAAPGATVTVEQTSVNEGLVIDDEIGTVEPCEANFPLFIPLCTTGELDELQLESTGVLFENAVLGAGDGDEDGSTPDAGSGSGGSPALPDTGGSNAGLLGLGAGLLALGGWLTARGRRRPVVHGALAD